MRNQVILLISYGNYYLGLNILQVNRFSACNSARLFLANPVKTSIVCFSNELI